MRRDAYQAIADRIITLLEKGTVPWHKPWGGEQLHPRNLTSGKKYRGINTFVLSTAEFESPYWITYKQAADRDGHVRKGEKGFPCVFWNWTEKDNPDTGQAEKYAFLKYYTVFNAEQCEGIEYPRIELPENQHTPIEACERLVREMPHQPEIRHGGHSASYSPLADLVRMPQPERFDDPESYYSTLFHELTHSTGHASRIARPGMVKPTGFGSAAYAKEELTAEMGAAFLCGHTGIERTAIDNSASYISSWLKRLKNDSRLVVTAGAQAQKAADYILDDKPDYAETVQS